MLTLMACSCCEVQTQIRLIHWKFSKEQDLPHEVHLLQLDAAIQFVFFTNGDIVILEFIASLILAVIYYLQFQKTVKVRCCQSLLQLNLEFLIFMIIEYSSITTSQLFK